MERHDPLDIAEILGLDVAEEGFPLRALLGVPSPSRSPWGGFWVLHLLKRFGISFL